MPDPAADNEQQLRVIERRHPLRQLRQRRLVVEGAGSSSAGAAAAAAAAASAASAASSSAAAAAAVPLPAAAPSASSRRHHATRRRVGATATACRPWPTPRRVRPHPRSTTTTPASAAASVRRGRRMYLRRDAGATPPRAHLLLELVLRVGRARQRPLAVDALDGAADHAAGGDAAAVGGAAWTPAADCAPGALGYLRSTHALHIRVPPSSRAGSSRTRCAGSVCSQATQASSCREIAGRSEKLWPGAGRHEPLQAEQAPTLEPRRQGGHCARSTN